MFSKTVTEDDITRIKAFNYQVKSGVSTGEAWKNTMSGATTAGKRAVVELKKGTTTMEELEGAAKTTTSSLVGAKIATVALQTALSFGLALAVQGIVTVVQKIQEAMPTIENTAKRLGESSEKVNNIKTKVSSLNDELKTSRDRLDELLSKDNPTFVEQEEIEKLKTANNELEREIKLQEAALKTQNEENSKNFRESVNAISSYKQTDDIPWWARMSLGAFSETVFSAWETFGTNKSQDFSNKIDNYKTFATQISDIQKQISDAIDNGASTDEIKSLEDNLEILENYRKNYDTEIQSYVTSLKEAKDKLGDVDYSTLSEDTKQFLDYIQDVENTYLSLDNNNFDTVLQNIYNSDRFKEGKESIESLKEAGMLTTEALQNLYNDNNNVAVKNLIDDMQQVGLIGDVTAESLKKITNHINGVKEAVEEVPKENILTTFQDLMEEKGTDKNPSFVESIEKTIEKFQKLEDALTKFESGTLKDSEKISLFKTFPELTAYADNLGEGIRNLLSSMRTDTITNFNDKIAEFKKNGATEEDISKLESYRDTILKIADAVDSVKNALDSIKTVFTDLDGILKDYNENGYFSIDNLDKLSENGQRYLQYLTYENGQLKINEEAYKKLVLAQIDEIETKATLQATSDLQSLTDETTAKEYLAKVNIDLAQSQLTAAQAAFQYALALKLAEGGNVAKAAQKVADNLNTLRNIFASARSQVDDYSAAMLGAKSATEKKAQASEKAKKALEAEQHALEHSKKALEQEKKALEDTKSEYEKAQKAIEDLIKWTQNYIKQIKEDEVKALEDKKSKFDEIIDAEKEAIEQAKKLREAEDELGEKTNIVAKAKLQSDILSLDDSGAGKKAYKKAQEEYKTSQKDLQDYLYNREVTAREEALDKLKEDTDKSYDEQIKTIQDYLSDEVQLYRDACSMIDNDNGTLYAKLLNYCLTYTTTGKTEFDRMWTLAQSAMEKYNVASVGTMQFMDELKGRIYDIDDAVDTLSKSIQNYEDRLTEVKNQLDDIKDAAIEAKNAIDIANSTPLIAKTDSSDTSSNSGSFAYAGRGYDASRGMYYYKVQYGDRDYFGYVGDSSDTDRVRNSAALAITKEIGKYVSGFENYGLSQIQGLLKVNAKNLGHYATGTKHSPAEFISQENGLEAIFAKNPNGSGSYTLTTPDSKVFDDKRTNELYDFSGNPSEYIKNALIPLTQEELSKFGAWGDMSQVMTDNEILSTIKANDFLKQYNAKGNVPDNQILNNINIYNTINGDVTPQMLRLLEQKEKDIIDKSIGKSVRATQDMLLRGRNLR